MSCFVIDTPLHPQLNALEVKYRQVHKINKYYLVECDPPITPMYQPPLSIHSTVLYLY